MIDDSMKKDEGMPEAYQLYVLHLKDVALGRGSRQQRWKLRPEKYKTHKLFLLTKFVKNIFNLVICN